MERVSRTPDAVATPLRLGVGEYAGRGDLLSGPTPAGFGRLVFLGAVAETCPAAIEDLLMRSGTVLETYRPLVRSMDQDIDRRFGRKVAALVRRPSDPRRRDRQRSLCRALDRWFSHFFRGRGRGFALAWSEAMVGWMDRWRLGDLDHLEIASIAFGLASLVWRHSTNGTSPDDAEVFAAIWFLTMPLRDLEMLLPPTAKPRTVRPWVAPPPPWDRVHETKAAYLERASAGIVGMLAAQVNALEAQGLAEGNERVPVKTSGVEHFRWLARYQVGGERLSTIARSLSDDGIRRPSTVHGAIEGTARLIDLPLREPDPRGRPRAPRTSKIIRTEPPAA